MCCMEPATRACMAGKGDDHLLLHTSTTQSCGYEGSPHILCNHVCTSRDERADIDELAVGDVQIAAARRQAAILDKYVWGLVKKGVY